MARHSLIVTRLQAQASAMLKSRLMVAVTVMPSVTM
jgi:hypothetical protein